MSWAVAQALGKDGMVVVLDWDWFVDAAVNYLDVNLLILLWAKSDRSKANETLEAEIKAKHSATALNKQRHWKMRAERKKK